MYLSHLRKTEIRNFSSVLRILWDEFRNYLIAFSFITCYSISNIVCIAKKLIYAIYKFKNALFLWQISEEKVTWDMVRL